MDFSKYFLMIDETNPIKTSNIITEYTLSKTKNQIDWDIDSIKVEIPKEHGNLNHVCRVSDNKGHSIYIKQAGDSLRISEDMKATLDRNRQESEILQIEEKYAKGMVPHIYFYDTVMSACGMEDCSDFEIMRFSMLEHKIFKGFADKISEFMVNTLLMTSDIVMDHKEKKELTRKFITPDLDDITEKLVLMEPYLGAERNNIFLPNKEFVEIELYKDELLHLEVSKLKFNFMSNAEALLHGDLHTGSIFIKENEIKVFDCEFGTFAPMGYDIGNIVANMIFAYVNGLVYEKEDFCKWVNETIENIIDGFINKYNYKYDRLVTEPMAKVKGFKEYYLGNIISDAAGYTGTELHRRTIGMANVLDLTSIEDAYKRTLAERITILAGKKYILNRNDIKTGKDFISILEESILLAKIWGN